MANLDAWAESQFQREAAATKALDELRLTPTPAVREEVARDQTPGSCEDADATVSRPECSRPDAAMDSAAMDAAAVYRSQAAAAVAGPPHAHAGGTAVDGGPGATAATGNGRGLGLDLGLLGHGLGLGRALVDGLCYRTTARDGRDW